jgi:glycosyltransferase involved in cell wall biosynthesis
MPQAASGESQTRGSAGPLVSIIIPCYNGRQFVGEAIESAFAQSYRNIEVVVVDDGSTDGSSEVIKSYPVLFVQGEHGGVSVARNLGVAASHGEFLVFLDSDDHLLPNAIAAGLAAFEKNPDCSMAVGAHNITSNNGERIVMRQKPCALRNGYELLLRSNFIECTSSVMFRRSSIKGNDAFRPGLGGAEDYELYLRLAREGAFCCHGQVVTEYRLHEGSASRKSAMMLSDTLAVFSEQWPFARRSMKHMWSFLKGSLFWRRKYGRQLTVEMATSDALSPQESKKAWRLLARSYPFGMLVVLASRVLPRNLVKSVLQRA